MNFVRAQSSQAGAWPNSVAAVVAYARRVPATLLIGLTALVVAGAPPVADLLQFDRAAIEAGEYWRLVTSHVTHWNGEHLLWDLLMFVVLGAACELRCPKTMRACLLASAGVVSALVWFGFPEMHTYRGLSGIDSALFTLLAVGIARDAWRDEDRRRLAVAIALLVAFAGKTLLEAFTGQTLFVEQEAAGFVPLVWDHLAAGVVGCAVMAGSLFPGASDEA